VGEVLGVFAQADLKRATFLRRYYRTSARRLNQLRLENRLKQLWSPKWPEDTLGRIDTVKSEAGWLLFEKNCVSCHQVVPHGQQKTPVDVVITPLPEIATDPTTALNAALSVSLTGGLEGSRLPGLDPLPAEVSTGTLLKNVVRGAIISPFRDVALKTSLLGRLRDDFRTLEGVLELKDAEINAFFEEMDVDPKDLDQLLRNFEQKQDAILTGQIAAALRDMDKILDEKSVLRSRYAKRKAALEAIPAEESPAASAERKLGYKARPLDGIWATAPYLHNGSVPNLYELVSPVAERSKRFHVGSTEFDPKRVGFSTEEVPGATTELDVSLPGNSNAGHDTYGNFTPEQRWQLVEYMKTL
jgi:hypothetical protein